MKKIAPIETRYNNYRFRSRLEARWAVFMDTIGLAYRYEHEGVTLPSGKGYLPDFYLPDFDYYLEIKPDKNNIAPCKKVWVGGCPEWDTDYADVSGHYQSTDGGTADLVVQWLCGELGFVDAFELGYLAAKTDVVLAVTPTQADAMALGESPRIKCVVRGTPEDTIRQLLPLHVDEIKTRDCAIASGKICVLIAGDPWPGEFRKFSAMPHDSYPIFLSRDEGSFPSGKGHCERWDAGFKAARTARFEHGETPRGPRA